MISLYERLESYEQLYDNKVVSGIPVIVKSSIRNYESVVKNLKKPFDEDFSEILQNTLLHTVSEIDSAIFAYSFAGEFIFVLKNDLESNQAPFCNNKIQDISSIVSSLLTSVFNKFYLASDNPPDIIGDVVFKTKTFCTPNIEEACNYLVNKQQSCNFYSVSIVLFNEMSKTYQSSQIKGIIENKSISDKKALLETKYGIVFNDYYQTIFRKGFCAYKAPKIINSTNGSFIKKKWLIDINTTDFFEKREFILNILNNGQDVLDFERDVNKT